MGYEDKRHIEHKKETFYTHVQNGDYHAYISLQILCERATKQYFKPTLDIPNNLSLASYLKALKEENRDQEELDVINHMLHINSIANRIKHSEYVLNINYSEIKNSVYSYNKYIKNVLDADNIYLLDETQVFRRGKVITNSDFFNKTTLKNTTQTVKIGKIDIWTGTSNKDLGFEIHNINFEMEHPISVYAAIYNFLQRSHTLKENQFLKRKSFESGIKIDLFHTFRIEMAILNLIRYGYYDENGLSVYSNKHQQELNIAISDIENYFHLFSNISKCEKSHIKISINETGILLGFNEDRNFDGINIIDHSTRDDYITDLWFSPSIVFDVEKEYFSEAMHYFLKEFFNYSSFLPHQLECFKQCIKQNKSLYILPTGSGKSLIFYMIALLSPSPTIIVCPTKILIEDQIRNLKEFYDIDDAYHSQENYVTSNFLNHKFVYLVPEQIQYKNLILKIIDYNVNYKISNVILDEVHCLCNWSHDFRPSYFVLAYNMAMFMDNARFVSLTATANYKTVKDIIRQLKIPMENVIHPLIFDPNLYNFKFIPCKSEEEIFENLISCVEKIEYSSKYNDKTIIFTQNIDETNQIWNNLANVAETTNVSKFDEVHTYSYLDFLTKKRFLVASGDMGVGINLPAIQNIINYGYPISKTNYVQEIGRSTRANTKGNSFIIYKDIECLSDSEKELLNCNTDINHLITIVKNSPSSSIVSLLQKIIGKFETSEKTLENLHSILKKLNVMKIKNVIISDDESIDKMHEYLYILKNIGIVENWYLERILDEKKHTLFQIELHDVINLDKIKNRTIRYLNALGTNFIYTDKIISAKSLEDVITIYLDWFYQEYLYYHREQLINVIDFININANKDSTYIGNALSPYFSINLMDIENNKNNLNDLYVEDILNMNRWEISTKKIIAEELLAATYNVKYDLIILLEQMYSGNNTYSNRYLRILKELNPNERTNFICSTWKYIPKDNISLRFQIIKNLTSTINFAYAKRKLYPNDDFDKAYYIYIMHMYNNTIDQNINNSQKGATND